MLHHDFRAVVVPKTQLIEMTHAPFNPLGGQKGEITAEYPLQPAELVLESLGGLSKDKETSQRYMQRKSNSRLETPAVYWWGSKTHVLMSASCKEMTPNQLMLTKAAEYSRICRQPHYKDKSNICRQAAACEHPRGEAPHLLTSGWISIIQLLFFLLLTAPT